LHRLHGGHVLSQCGLVIRIELAQFVVGQHKLRAEFFRQKLLDFQGDSELAGTAIEMSLTGLIQVTVHKKKDLPGTDLEALYYPLLETQDEWVVHGFSYGNYLNDLGDKAQQAIYSQSSVDKAMRDAFRKMRHFLMTTKNLSEDEAISLMSVAVDFGITQVVDGNWGVHATIRKSIFAGAQK
jgi:acetamidase/formamidase